MVGSAELPGQQHEGRRPHQQDESTEMARNGDSESVQAVSLLRRRCHTHSDSDESSQQPGRAFLDEEGRSMEDGDLFGEVSPIHLEGERDGFRGEVGR